jgi:DNA-binding NarL/FixJ family response regulator
MFSWRYSALARDEEMARHNKTIRILLADDHAMVRDGLAALLGKQDDFEVVALAANGLEAVEQSSLLKPDVALIDIVMPGLNGIEATAHIHRENPSIHIVVVSMHSDIDYVYRALRAGAQGYVAKTSAGVDLVEAVRSVLAGRRYLSRGIPESVLDYRSRERALKSPLEQLSTRERQILQLHAEGHGSASISTILSVSPRTVDTYRCRVIKKLGIADLAALIRFAIRHGMTPPD